MGKKSREQWSAPVLVAALALAVGCGSPDPEPEIQNDAPSSLAGAVYNLASAPGICAGAGECQVNFFSPSEYVATDVASGKALSRGSYSYTPSGTTGTVELLPNGTTSPFTLVFDNTSPAAGTFTLADSLGATVSSGSFDANLPEEEVLLGPQQMAFVSNRDGNPDIYVMNADGTDVQQLTADAGVNSSPAGSPDGKSIAFVSDRAGDPDIFVMSVTGSSPQNLTANSGKALRAGGQVDSEPSWSPDGKQILFTTNRDRTPDEENYEIYRMSSDGSNPTNLTKNPKGDRGASWSPEGSRILFYSYRDGNAEIYAMDADGTNPVNLSKHCEADTRPQWSEDGQQIVFESDRDGDSKIFVMNADGSNVRPLHRLSRTGYEGGAAWSPITAPDGPQIAFTSNHDGIYQIYVIDPDDPDGTNVQRLSSANGDDGAPTWLVR